MRQHSAPSFGRRKGRFPVRRQYSLISDLKDGGKERYFSELFCSIVLYLRYKYNIITIDTNYDTILLFAKPNR